MDDGRAADEQHFGSKVGVACGLAVRPRRLPVVTNHPHALGHVGDHRMMRPFRRHVGCHEGERVPLFRPFQREDPNAGSARDDEGTGFHFGHGNGVSRRRIHGHANGDVHFDRFHVEPVVVEADLRPEVRGRIKRIRQHAVFRGGFQGAIGGVFDNGPMRLNGVQDGRKPLRGVGMHGDRGRGCVLSRGSDLHLVDGEGSASLENRVEYLRQDERVDDMAFEGHGFSRHSVIVHLWEARTLPCPHRGSGKGKFLWRRLRADDILMECTGQDNGNGPLGSRAWWWLFSWAG